MAIAGVDANIVRIVAEIEPRDLVQVRPVEMDAAITARDDELVRTGEPGDALRLGETGDTADRLALVEIDSVDRSLVSGRGIGRSMTSGERGSSAWKCGGALPQALTGSIRARANISPRADVGPGEWRFT